MPDSLGAAGRRVPVTWLVERDVWRAGLVSGLRCALRDQGERMVLIERDGRGRCPDPPGDAPGPVVAYGSIGIADTARAEGWQPGTFGDERAMGGAAYARGLGPLFLNADAVFAPLREAESAMRAHGLARAFVKPSDDAKGFAGRVTDRAAVPAWRDGLSASGYLTDDDLDALVMLAPVRTLRREWRVVAAGGVPVAASLYREDGEARLAEGAPPEVLSFAARAIGAFAPAPAFMCDAAETPDGLRVVEYNAFCSSDLYAADLSAVTAAACALARAGAR